MPPSAMAPSDAAPGLMPGSADSAPAPAAQRGRPAGRLVLGAFAAALFANAALLFWVEPLFSKLVLPLLGGTAAVWTTCLLFFQAALVAGYLYAHLAGRLRPRAQLAVHAALLALAAAAALPLGVRAGPPPAADPPVPWLAAVLAASLGAPFVALAAGAPLLQRWFAGTSHPDARNPYFLYAASNLGSLAALLAFPLLLEPRVPLAAQARWWGVGYGAVALLVLGCALVAGRHPAPAFADAPAIDASPTPSAPSAPSRVRPAEALRWTFLALVPSSLLLGLTSYLTTDIAPMPLLWVGPLALYLLTFVAAFARRPLVPHRAALAVHAPSALAVAALVAAAAPAPLWLLLAAHLGAFFFAALACHGELARTRPDARHLTAFYLWVSVGGALGGAFNAVVAPLAFDDLAEYPLALAAALALRPAFATRRAGDGPLAWSVRRSAGRGRAAAGAGAAESGAGIAPPVSGRLAALGDAVLPALVALATYAVLTRRWDGVAAEGRLLTSALLAWLGYRWRGRPLRLAFAAAALLAAGARARAEVSRPLFQGRSFFSTYTVRPWDDGRYHMLQHGTTLHGAQSRVPGRTREPLTYFHRAGPLAQVFASLPERPGGRRVALAGLGAGTMLCYGRPADRWTVYEIDPLMVRIAQDPRLFTFWRDCPPRRALVLGDARLRLAEAPAGSFDLILLDAFSSDAVPVHLLTRKAIAMYRGKLAPGGLLVFNASNRYLNLIPTFIELARDARMAGAVGADRVLSRAQRAGLATDAVYVVLAQRAADLAALRRQPLWLPLPPIADAVVWTDDYAAVFGALRWR